MESTVRWWAFLTAALWISTVAAFWSEHDSMVWVAFGGLLVCPTASVVGVVLSSRCLAKYGRPRTLQFYIVTAAHSTVVLFTTLGFMVILVPSYLRMIGQH